MLDLTSQLAALPVVQAGFLGSLAAGLATGVGALPIFFREDWPRRSRVIMLAAAAGIMLAATVFSLMLPALDAVVASGGTHLRAALVVSAGVMLGALAIWLVHGAVPHEHFDKGQEGGLFKSMATSLGHHWLFIVAITLHNFPEGASVGVAYGGGNVGNGLSATIGIGLQNMPEGLAVAAALVSTGFSRGRAFALALLTGLVEPVGGLLGAAVVSFSDAVLPWGLAFSAGAMLFVISGEIIPETHREKQEHRATMTLVAGFLAMMILDVTLG